MDTLPRILTLPLILTLTVSQTLTRTSVALGLWTQV